MIRIKYKQEKIEVPESWDDITLGFYESFYAEKPNSPREKVELVAKICKTDADLLLSWPAEVFNRIVEYLDFIFKGELAPPSPRIKIGKVNYVVPIEDVLSLGEWVDITEAQREGKAVLSNVLAIVCRPAGEEYNYKNNEERQAMFAALPVSKVLPVLAFFLQCKVALERRTATYTKLYQALAQLPLNIKTYLNAGGGIRLSRIWPAIKFWILTLFLRVRLRRFLRSYNTAKRKVSPMRRNIN